MARKSLKNIISLVESTTTSAPVEKQFIADLKYSIEKTDEKEVRTPSRTFKPSSIGGCQRAIFYQLIGEPFTEERSSSNLVGICENGTDRHIRIQQAIEAMKDNGIDCEYVDVADFIQQRGLDYIEIKEKSGMETKCYWADIPLSFLTDGIIKYKGKYYILEIKTMNSKKYFESKDVRPEHKAQGICYSMAFKIEDVFYLYECRDTLDKKAFIFHVTDEMREELLEKTRNIKKCVAENRLPDIPEDKKCVYCHYKQSCQNNQISA